MSNHIKKQELISDFREISTFSYKDYVDIKGFPYLSISNLNNNNISKSYNILKINNKSIKVDSLSVNDIINILFKKVEGISIAVYEEHPEDYLNSSGTFLSDFSTDFATKFYTSEPIVNLDLINTYKDRFNNIYALEELRVYDQYSNEIPYYKREDSIRIAKRDERFTIVCRYKATDLKVNFLLEYPLSSLDQLTFTNNLEN